MDESPRKPHEPAAPAPQEADSVPSAEHSSFWQELKRRKVTRVDIT